MKRRAIIIANPGLEGTESYLGGVLKDISNYQSFLCSELGGCWLEGEIVKLIRPSVNRVRNTIQGLSNVDYALIIFSGHGCHDTQRDSTVVDLGDEDIDSIELRSGASKQTLILDCCRKKSPTTLMEARDMKFAKAAPRRKLSTQPPMPPCRHLSARCAPTMKRRLSTRWAAMPMI